MSPDPPPGLDPERLRGLPDRELPGLVGGPLEARLIEGGRSDLTYAVTDGTGRWVVRRPPLGHVPATAHDMGREHRVRSAPRPTAVPVPRPVLLCEDESVLGAPFHVREFVPGTPCRTAGQLAPLGAERTRAAGLGLVDTLVELHAVDPRGAGLGGFGRPDGFLERQLRRWGEQLAVARGREPAGIGELRAAPGATCPPPPPPPSSTATARLDNVLLGDDDRITAALGWEMPTLGDPLTDLGLLAVYSTPLDVPEGLAGTTATAAGHPAAREPAERYAARSGRDASRLPWYTEFARVKLAVIPEGVHHRYTIGRTVGAGFDRVGEPVPLFVEHGLTTLREGRPPGLRRGRAHRVERSRLPAPGTARPVDAVGDRGAHAGIRAVRSPRRARSRKAVGRAVRPQGGGRCGPERTGGRRPGAIRAVRPRGRGAGRGGGGGARSGPGLRAQGPQQEAGEVVGDLPRAERTVGAVPGRQVVHRPEVVVDDQVGGGVRGEHPGTLALLDEGAEPLVVAAPLGADLPVLLRAQVVHGAEEDRRVVEVLDGGDDDVGGGVPQPLLDRRVGAREGVQPLLLEAQHAGVHLVQQVLLGAEVVVEGPLGDPRRLDDLLHGGAGVTLLGEETGGGGQQSAGDGGGPVPVRRPGHVSPHLLVVRSAGRATDLLTGPGPYHRPVASQVRWMRFMPSSHRSGSAARAR